MEVSEKALASIELKIPKGKFLCNLSSSTLAYIASKKPLSLQKSDKADFAVLSTTARAKARRKKSSDSANTTVEPSMDVEISSNMPAKMEHELMPTNDNVLMETQEAAAGVAGRHHQPALPFTVIDESESMIDAFKKTA